MSPPPPAFVALPPAPSAPTRRPRHRPPSMSSSPSPPPLPPSPAPASPPHAPAARPPPTPTHHLPITPPHARTYFTPRHRAPFFEGWYLRLTLPNLTSFAFMFSLEAGPHPCTVQLLPPTDDLHIATLSPSRLRASSPALDLAVWGYPAPAALSGFRLTAHSSHGSLRSERGVPLQWAFDYAPTLAWGPRGTACCTATWLSRLPMFDPGYQVLMARGVVTGGYVSVDGRRVDVEGAVAYCEKNWGSSFPRRWWWVQAAIFDDVDDLSLTAVGSTRQTLGVEEIVGMIAVHFDGKFYEFANWNCRALRWSVSGWGRWSASATSRTGHSATLFATTPEPYVDVLGPGKAGLVFNVRDCARGELTLTLRDPDGVPILDNVSSRAAQLETGGELWTDVWDAEVSPMSRPVRAAVNALWRGAETGA